jgi:hypothetical protein
MIEAVDPCELRTFRNLADLRAFAALSALNKRYSMDFGAARSRSDFEITAKLARSRSDAINTNPGAERRTVLLAHRPATIVSDYHVHPIGDPSQINGHM